MKDGRVTPPADEHPDREERFDEATTLKELIFRLRLQLCWRPSGLSMDEWCAKNTRDRQVK